MEDLGVLGILLHDFKDYVRLLWFWDLYGIVLLIIEVDPVFIVRFAHLASEGSPFDADAELALYHIQPLP